MALTNELAKSGNILFKYRSYIPLLFAPFLIYFMKGPIPEYLNTIKGPFKDILLLAVGGIKASNVGEYLRAGASAVAVGGSIFSPARIKNNEFEVIKKDVSEFVLAVNLYYSKINEVSN